MLKVTDVRHTFPERAGFFIDRKNGYGHGYTLLHFHNSVELVLGGELTVTEPHALIIFDPQTPQYFKSREPLIHDWMHFDANEGELDGVPTNTVFYPANFAYVTETTAEIEYEFYANEEGREEMLRLKLKELFIKLGRASRQEYKSENPEMLEKFRALRGKMFMSLDEKWTVGRMAEALYLSESRFYALYKKFFGISPISDLINAKMNSAKNMLLFRDKRIDEIAALLGYQNTTHFIRQFREYIGTTPAKYRRDNA